MYELELLHGEQFRGDKVLEAHFKFFYFSTFGEIRSF